jgi:hypothetical protein
MIPAILMYKPSTIIGIFRTNITTRYDRQRLLHAIESHFDVGPCHIDLEDCDKVLRILDMKVDEQTMIHFVRQYGFQCELLE